MEAFWPALWCCFSSEICARYSSLPLAIPTSVIATFTLVKMMDFTLNNMTLLALTLSVGIVIDDAIVVLENIVRYIEEKAYPAKRAAIEATKEIALAVLATTISLVIIFVPIAFMTGYARRYVNEFGWTMAFAIVVSMLVSFTLTPMLSSRLLRFARKDQSGSDTPADGHARTSKNSRFFGWTDRAYGRMLEWSLDHRAVIVLVSLGVFALSFPLNRLVGRDWIPPDDQSELNLSLYLPEGTSVEGTSKTVSEIARKIRKLAGVEFVNPYIHEGGFGSTNHAHIYIRLIDVSKRDFSNQDVAAEIRKITAATRNLRSRVQIPSALMTGENFYPIQLRILGPDFFQAAELAKKVSENARHVPGLLDVDPGVSLSSPELQVKIDRQRASDLGVRASDVASAVRLMISGEDQITTYKEGDEQYDVTMQLLPEQKEDPQMLARLMIPSSRLGQVRLDNIATIERGVGPARIERYNRQFQVSVNANHATDFPLDAASRAVVEEVQKVGLPAGYGYRSSGNVKMLDETASEPGDCFRPGFHLHVHGPGRSVRELSSSLHHNAELAAVDPVRAVDALADRPHPQSLECARCASAARHCEEERNSSGGLHQPAAGPGYASARGHRAGEPCSTAADSDDDVCHRCRIDSNGSGARRRIGSALGHSRDDHRRPDALPASHVADHTRGLLDFRTAGGSPVVCACRAATRAPQSERHAAASFSTGLALRARAEITSHSGAKPAVNHEPVSVS